jgi:hypothetical protein
MDKTNIAHASNQYVEKLNIVLKTLRKYLKTSTMVTVIFMQSVMEIALPLKSYPLKTGQICQECDVLA